MPFLAAGHHVESPEHLVERDASMLKHCANLHGELLFAVAAAIQAEADSLVGHYSASGRSFST